MGDRGPLMHVIPFSVLLLRCRLLQDLLWFSCELLHLLSIYEQPPQAEMFQK